MDRTQAYTFTGSMNQYDREKEELNHIIGWEGAKILLEMPIPLSETLYAQAKFLLSEMQSSSERIASRYLIDKMKEEMKEKGFRNFPAIAVEVMGRGTDWEYFHIADGNHRVVAAYEMGMQEIPAVIVRKR